MFKFHVVIIVYNYIVKTIVSLEYNGYIYGIIILDMIPKVRVGDLILVKTKLNIEVQILNIVHLIRVIWT